MDTHRHLLRCGSQVVLPTWRVLSHWHKVLNREVFDSCLKSPILRTGVDTGDAAYFDTVEYTSRIRVTAEPMTKRMFLDLLVHEMVHQYQYETEQTVCHNKSFWAWRDKVHALGLNLRLVYDV